MILKSALGKLYRFGNRFLCNGAPPLSHDRVPRHSLGNLFQHLRHHDPCTQESRLAMTDFWIGDHVAPQPFFLLSWHIPVTPLVVFPRSAAWPCCQRDRMSVSRTNRLMGSPGPRPSCADSRQWP